MYVAKVLINRPARAVIKLFSILYRTCNCNPANARGARIALKNPKLISRAPYSQFSLISVSSQFHLCVSLSTRHQGVRKRGSRLSVLDYTPWSSEQKHKQYNNSIRDKVLSIRRPVQAHVRPHVHTKILDLQSGPKSTHTCQLMRILFSCPAVSFSGISG